MKQIFLPLLFLFTMCNLVAQNVVVNPDGTHSIVIDNGSTKTIVNPNGTHSTVIDNCSTKIVVNPNGTHSIVVGSGRIKTVVNPDGTHSIFIDNGAANCEPKRYSRIHFGLFECKNNRKPPARIRVRDKKD